MRFWWRGTAVLALCGLAMCAQSKESGSAFMRASHETSVAFPNGVSLRSWKVQTSGVGKLTVRLLRLRKERESVVSEQTLTLGTKPASEGDIYLLITETKTTKERRYEPSLQCVFDAATETSTLSWKSVPVSLSNASGLMRRSESATEANLPPGKNAVLYSERFASVELGKELPPIADGKIEEKSNSSSQRYSDATGPGFAIVVQWTPTSTPLVAK